MASTLRLTGRHVLMALAVGVATWSGGGAAAAGGTPCAGDCDGDRTVVVSELVQAVAIALGGAPVARCAAADSTPDGLVAINELVRAVDSALAGCPAEVSGPDLIVVDRLNLQPEGIEYDRARGRFLVGSRTSGVIHAVDDAGAITAVVAESGLGGMLGLHIDRPRDRLLAAGVLAGTTNAALGIYALGSGAPLHVVDLAPLAGAGAHLLNDVVTDSEGNAYVTDTFSPMIYRVDRDGAASIFASDGALALANGIELHADRFLIVATLGGPSLVRVSLDDPPVVSAVATEVAVAGDGIAFTANGDLVVVESGANAGRVTLLRSADAWASATVVASWDAGALGFGAPTTAAVRGMDVHVIFGHLFDDSRARYEIARARF